MSSFSQYRAFELVMMILAVVVKSGRFPAMWEGGAIGFDDSNMWMTVVMRVGLPLSQGGRERRKKKTKTMRKKGLKI